MLKHMRETGVYDWPNVIVLEGRWQDILKPDNIAKVLATDESEELAEAGFDAVFFDTFAEGYEGVYEEGTHGVR